MAKIRDLLVHVSAERAKGLRKCSRNKKKHQIQKGEICLCVKSGPRNRPMSYCAACAEEMLKIADAKLKSIATELNLSV